MIAEKMNIRLSWRHEFIFDRLFVNISFARSFRSNNDAQKKARQSLAMHLAHAVLPWLSEVFRIFLLGLLRIQRFCLSKKIRAKTFDPHLCITADESEPPQYCVLFRYYFIVCFHFMARRSYSVDDWHSTFRHILMIVFFQLSSTILRRISPLILNWHDRMCYGGLHNYTYITYTSLCYHLQFLSFVIKFFEFLRQFLFWFYLQRKYSSYKGYIII